MGAGCRRKLVILLLLICFSDIFCFCVASAPAARVSAIQSNGWVRLYGEAGSNAVQTLEASSNLVDWRVVAVMHAHSFEFADPVSPHLPNRFYRFSTTALTPTNDWKNQILGPGASHSQPQDPFFGFRSWVKFAILTDDPTRVYYANSSDYLFHYDFATRRLDPFVGLDVAEFEELALRNEGREVILGAILLPPPLGIPEYGIQFVSRDPLPKEQVRELFELVKSTVVGRPNSRAFYMPSFDQLQAAEAERAWFESNGIAIASPERWADQNNCYSLGWTIGTLKFFKATEIDAAYADGRLRPEDILLTDAVPSELPYVAGIISLSPSTPSSHVAILARTYGVPFVYLIDPVERARARELVGREVALQLDRSQSIRPDLCHVGIHALDTTFDAALKAEILSAKNPPRVNITPVAPFATYTAPVDNLVPADVRFFGGKAANYGLLRRTIPSNAPPGIAISFDLWNEFMAQRLTNGNSLRQEISNRLAGLTYPAHVRAIKTNLNAIRTLIRQGTQFTTNQQQAIISALRAFDSRRNIRFRSSTNVEDTENFTGAGLYDSYSGCLDDDVDGDNAGPSHCDPTEEDERGVFRAIRRVYASFYNDNAYLERLRRGVDENKVGMAMLVHHSTPDPIEMANGIATVTGSVAELVTQKGAVPVANPDGTALPEILKGGSSLRVIQHSSLLPLGGYVMNWPADYQELTRLLFSVGSAYGNLMAKEGPFLLNFEYKKVHPGRLEVKQVRELPLPATNAIPAQYLVNDAIVFVPHQGVEADLFATHRLKSRWTLHTRNIRLNDTNLASTFLTGVTIEHLNSNRVATLSAPVQSLSNFSYSVRSLDGDWWTRNSWRMPTLSGPATVGLQTTFDSEVSSPLVTVRFFRLDVTYDQPVPPPQFGQTSWRTNETVVLVREVDPRAVPSARRIEHSASFILDGKTFTISTAGDYGIEGGDNPWLVGTLRTRIEGLTSEPIVLTNFYSQTAVTYHLSSAHGYIFEPRLEPGIAQAILRELEAFDIQLFTFGSGSPGLNAPGLEVMGRDGAFRKVRSAAERTLTINATQRQGQWPPGSTYTLVLSDGGTYTYEQEDGSFHRGRYTFERDGDRATLVRTYAYTFTSVLTFLTPTTGTIHTEYTEGAGETATEDGTFTLY